MVLHVFVGNVRAVRFYERADYQRWTRAAGFYGEAGDAWVYRKALAPKSSQGPLFNGL
jgi:ribosomal protein S18 acetylase RimI-like enzyme